MERDRLNRIAAEGPALGAELWAGLQSVINHDVAEFNQEFGDTVIRTKALGDGTFEVHFGAPGGTAKIAALNYAPDTTTLSWHIFGGGKGTPLKVGLQRGTDLQPNTNGLQFTDERTYYTLDVISRQIIENLLP